MTDEKTWLMEYMETFAAARGLALPPGAAERFYRYAAFLLAQNEKMNLTALKTLQAVADGHFLDSLAPAAMGLIPDGSRIIDIGCGPGLPGLPLRFALENSEVTLVDSQRKRVRFMEEFIADTGLSGAKPVCARAEALAADPAYRERFDVAVSRAVAGLSVLCELCLPFVRVGGVMLAYKGRGAQEEAEAARGAVSALAFAYDMPLVLILVGFVYLCETLSDIIQVAYFKATHGKRIFRMTPIHHHFEMGGWSEVKIVFVFTFVTALTCAAAYWGAIVL